MKNLYHRLLRIIAGSTQRELASQVHYLKIENQILRSKLPTRISVTEKERAKLARFGSKLGKALDGSNVPRSRGLLGIREAARQDKKLQFTSLLHHLTPELLRSSFFDLKKQAAPGGNDGDTAFAPRITPQVLCLRGPCGPK